ncbi:MAG: zincin-like metallopeptidase domain-containing protein [Pseudomonadota bacterium]
MSDRSDALYAHITARMITALEEGTLPWRKPWRGGGTPLPLRVCGTPYRGINIVALWFRADEAGLSGQHWMTYRQARALGAQVRRGEKGTRILKYGTRETDETDRDGTSRKIGFARVYTVFNTAQIDDLPAELAAREEVAATGPAPIDAYESFFAATGLDVQIEGTQAFFRPGTDSVHMPPYQHFEEVHGFYRVLAHEGLHATGHSSRLDRFPEKTSSESYAWEELIAELGACFLGARIGLEPAEDNAAAYLAHWIGVLREDPKTLQNVVSAAQAGADWLIDAAGPGALPGHMPHQQAEAA